MTMGDEALSQVVSSSSTSSAGLFVYRHPYSNNNINNNNNIHFSAHGGGGGSSSSATVKMLANNNSYSGGGMRPHGVGGVGGVVSPNAFTVLAGLSVQHSSPDHHSLPSSDIGEVDLDLWDLDINAPSVTTSSGGLSPAVLPGRRSSDTSSTTSG